MTEPVIDVIDNAPGVWLHLNPFKFNPEAWALPWEAGLYYHPPTGSMPPIWIANPIYVIEMRFDLDGDLEKVFRFKNIWGEWIDVRVWVKHMLTMQDSFLGRLVEKGFIFDIEYKDKLINYLIREKPRNE